MCSYTEWAELLGWDDKGVPLCFYYRRFVLISVLSNGLFFIDEQLHNSIRKDACRVNIIILSAMHIGGSVCRVPAY